MNINVIVAYLSYIFELLEGFMLRILGMTSWEETTDESTSEAEI